MGTGIRVSLYRLGSVLALVIILLSIAGLMSPGLIFFVALIVGIGAGFSMEGLRTLLETLANYLRSILSDTEGLEGLEDTSG